MATRPNPWGWFAGGLVLITVFAVVMSNPVLSPLRNDPLEFLDMRPKGKYEEYTLWSRGPNESFYRIVQMGFMSKWSCEKAKPLWRAGKLKDRHQRPGVLRVTKSRRRHHILRCMLRDANPNAVIDKRAW